MESSFETIAKAVVLWEHNIVPNNDFVDESFGKQILEFLTTIDNFLPVFEVEFVDIIFEYCDAFMSGGQFFNFVNPRIKLLSHLRGYFGYILPCVFVREVIYRFKTSFHRFPFVEVAQKCIEKVLKRKFQESGINNNCHGLFDYCVDINTKFKRFEDDDSEDFKHETLSASENSEQALREIVGSRANESFNWDKTTYNTKDKCNSAYASIESTTGVGLQIKNEMNTNDNISDNLISGMNLNKPLDYSDTNSGISLEVDKKQTERGKHNICKVNESTSSGFASRNKETDLSIDKELNEKYDILMPDSAFRYEVFNLIEKCKEKLDRTEN